MHNILVTTIIPTYKRADLLPKAIDSVLNQTYRNIEVIVVDDNNPKTEFRYNTEQIMENYKNDGRVIYLKHDKNRNGAAARNTGINTSKGEVICFLDDDDFFINTKIEKQLNCLLNDKEYDGVYCGRLHSGKNVTSEQVGNLSKTILLVDFIPGTPTLMFYKKALIEIGGFNEKYLRHQDSELLLRFFENHKINSVPEQLVIVGENEGENEVHGTELEKLKTGFINEFALQIDSYGKKFRKNVYCKQYTYVFFDYLQIKQVNSAIKIYFKSAYKYPIMFSYYILRHALNVVKFRLRRLWQ